MSVKIGMKSLCNLFIKKFLGDYFEKIDKKKGSNVTGSMNFLRLSGGIKLKNLVVKKHAFDSLISDFPFVVSSGSLGNLSLSIDGAPSLVMENLTIILSPKKGNEDFDPENEYRRKMYEFEFREKLIKKLEEIENNDLNEKKKSKRKRIPFLGSILRSISRNIEVTIRNVEIIYENQGSDRLVFHLESLHYSKGDEIVVQDKKGDVEEIQKKVKINNMSLCMGGSDYPPCVIEPFSVEMDLSVYLTDDILDFSRSLFCLKSTITNLDIKVTEKEYRTILKLIQFAGTFSSTEEEPLSRDQLLRDLFRSLEGKSGENAIYHENRKRYMEYYRTQYLIGKRKKQISWIDSDEFKKFKKLLPKRDDWEDMKTIVAKTDLRTLLLWQGLVRSEIDRQNEIWIGRKKKDGFVRKVGKEVVKQLLGVKHKVNRRFRLLRGKKKKKEVKVQEEVEEVPEEDEGEEEEEEVGMGRDGPVLTEKEKILCYNGFIERSVDTESLSRWDVTVDDLMDVLSLKKISQDDGAGDQSQFQTHSPEKAVGDIVKKSGKEEGENAKISTEKYSIGFDICKTNVTLLAGARDENRSIGKLEVHDASLTLKKMSDGWTIHSSVYDVEVHDRSTKQEEEEGEEETEGEEDEDGEWKGRKERNRVLYRNEDQGASKKILSGVPPMDEDSDDDDDDEGKDSRKRKEENEKKKKEEVDEKKQPMVNMDFSIVNNKPEKKKNLGVKVELLPLSIVVRPAFIERVVDFFVCDEIPHFHEFEIILKQKRKKERKKLAKLLRRIEEGGENTGNKKKKTKGETNLEVKIPSLTLLQDSDVEILKSKDFKLHLIREMNPQGDKFVTNLSCTSSETKGKVHVPTVYGIFQSALKIKKIAPASVKDLMNAWKEGSGKEKSPAIPEKEERERKKKEEEEEEEEDPNQKIEKELNVSIEMQNFDILFLESLVAQRGVRMEGDKFSILVNEKKRIEKLCPRHHQILESRGYMPILVLFGPTSFSFVDLLEKEVILEYSRDLSFSYLVQVLEMKKIPHDVVSDGPKTKLSVVLGSDKKPFEIDLQPAAFRVLSQLTSRIIFSIISALKYVNFIKKKKKKEEDKDSNLENNKTVMKELDLQVVLPGEVRLGMLEEEELMGEIEGKKEEDAESDGVALPSEDFKSRRVVDLAIKSFRFSLGMSKDSSSNKSTKMKVQIGGAKDRACKILECGEVDFVVDHVKRKHVHLLCDVHDMKLTPKSPHDFEKLVSVLLNMKFLDFVKYFGNEVKSFQYVTKILAVLSNKELKKSGDEDKKEEEEEKEISINFHNAKIGFGRDEEEVEEEEDEGEEEDKSKGKKDEDEVRSIELTFGRKLEFGFRKDRVGKMKIKLAIPRLEMRTSDDNFRTFRYIVHPLSIRTQKEDVKQLTLDLYMKTIIESETQDGMKIDLRYSDFEPMILKAVQYVEKFSHSSSSERMGMLKQSIGKHRKRVKSQAKKVLDVFVSQAGEDKREILKRYLDDSGGGKESSEFSSLVEHQKIDFKLEVEIKDVVSVEVFDDLERYRLFLCELSGMKLVSSGKVLLFPNILRYGSLDKPKKKTVLVLEGLSSKFDFGVSQHYYNLGCFEYEPLIEPSSHTRYDDDDDDGNVPVPFQIRVDWNGEGREVFSLTSELMKAILLKKPKNNQRSSRKMEDLKCQLVEHILNYNKNCVLGVELESTGPELNVNATHMMMDTFLRSYGSWVDQTKKAVRSPRSQFSIVNYSGVPILCEVGNVFSEDVDHVVKEFNVVHEHQRKEKGLFLMSMSYSMYKNPRTVWIGLTREKEFCIGWLMVAIKKSQDQKTTGRTDIIIHCGYVLKNCCSGIEWHVDSEECKLKPNELRFLPHKISSGGIRLFQEKKGAEFVVTGSLIYGSLDEAEGPIFSRHILSDVGKGESFLAVDVVTSEYLSPVRGVISRRQLNVQAPLKITNLLSTTLNLSFFSEEVDGEKLLGGEDLIVPSEGTEEMFAFDMKNAIYVTVAIPGHQPTEKGRFLFFHPGNGQKRSSIICKNLENESMLKIKLHYVEKVGTRKKKKFVDEIIFYVDYWIHDRISSRRSEEEDEGEEEEADVVNLTERLELVVRKKGSDKKLFQHTFNHYSESSGGVLMYSDFEVSHSLHPDNDDDTSDNFKIQKYRAKRQHKVESQSKAFTIREYGKTKEVVLPSVHNFGVYTKKKSLFTRDVFLVPRYEVSNELDHTIEITECKLKFVGELLKTPGKFSVFSDRKGNQNILRVEEGNRSAFHFKNFTASGFVMVRLDGFFGWSPLFRIDEPNDFCFHLEGGYSVLVRVREAKNGKMVVHVKKSAYSAPPFIFENQSPFVLCVEQIYPKTESLSFYNLLRSTAKKKEDQKKKSKKGGLSSKAMQTVSDVPGTLSKIVTETNHASLAMSTIDEKEYAIRAGLVKSYNYGFKSCVEVDNSLTLNAKGPETPFYLKNHYAKKKQVFVTAKVLKGNRGSRVPVHFVVDLDSFGEVVICLGGSNGKLLVEITGDERTRKITFSHEKDMVAVEDEPEEEEDEGEEEGEIIRKIVYLESVLSKILLKDQKKKRASPPDHTRGNKFNLRIRVPQKLGVSFINRRPREVLSLSVFDLLVTIGVTRKHVLWTSIEVGNFQVDNHMSGRYEVAMSSICVGDLSKIDADEDKNKSETSMETTEDNIRRKFRFDFSWRFKEKQFFHIPFARLLMKDVRFQVDRKAMENIGDFFYEFYKYLKPKKVEKKQVEKQGGASRFWYFGNLVVMPINVQASVNLVEKRSISEVFVEESESSKLIDKMMTKFPFNVVAAYLTYIKSDVENVVLNLRGYEMSNTLVPMKTLKNAISKRWEKDVKNQKWSVLVKAIPITPSSSPVLKDRQKKPSGWFWGTVHKIGEFFTGEKKELLIPFGYYPGVRSLPPFKIRHGRCFGNERCVTEMYKRGMESVENSILRKMLEGKYKEEEYITHFQFEDNCVVIITVSNKVICVERKVECSGEDKVEVCLEDDSKIEVLKVSEEDDIWCHKMSEIKSCELNPGSGVTFHLVKPVKVTSTTGEVVEHIQEISSRTISITKQEINEVAEKLVKLIEESKKGFEKEYI